MIRKEQIQEFQNILVRQTELLTQLNEQESRLQAIVADRDWPQLETLLPLIDEVGPEFEHLEERREELFTEMKFAAGGEQSFARLITRIPEEYRRTLTDAYRDLKVAVMRLRSRTANIDSYMRSTIGTLRGVLQELYPEHGTAVYSRNGVGGYTGGQAVVLSHHA